LRAPSPPAHAHHARNTAQRQHSQGTHAVAGTPCGDRGALQQGLRMHARVPAPLPGRLTAANVPHARVWACMPARRVPTPLPGRLVATMVAHSRTCTCMRARRVPSLLPEWLAAPALQHSRACASMRARRVPKPLPGCLAVPWCRTAGPAHACELAGYPRRCRRSSRRV